MVIRMGLYLLGLLATLTILSSCSGISQYNAVLPGDKTVIYIMGVNKSPVGGTDQRVCDRWSYNNKTGELKLERSDGSSSDKGITDALKGLPVPLAIPF
jgi:hypothetical protein